ncbi:helix-turn-helix transcriptional regulator [Erysipelothrix sp. HDW6C]|uniref:helix-turn-helix domain-containing protein n=1 Tax=Erysipelothrix sp. HDW6C TaxID=2714930 RepID=UPI00140C2E4C|nr:helix-turn-helix transcriptional regulator [Erysipelothrix sp. HDW6C]QIK69949.1 helix-turn-helix transcriptional regulator [Erysipelothrix sp. HDW6C]
MKVKLRKLDSISKRLKHLRLVNDMKQYEVAALFNTTASTIGFYERGVVEPNVQIIIAYADYFEVTCDWLLRNKSDKS